MRYHTATHDYIVRFHKESKNKSEAWRNQDFTQGSQFNKANNAFASLGTFLDETKFLFRNRSLDLAHWFCRFYQVLQVCCGWLWP